MCKTLATLAGGAGKTGSAVPARQRAPMSGLGELAYFYDPPSDYPHNESTSEPLTLRVSTQRHKTWLLAFQNS